jgi:tRNA U38,U39,U40 pseudouridine synthase TruA
MTIDSIDFEILNEQRIPAHHDDERHYTVRDQTPTATLRNSNNNQDRSSTSTSATAASAAAASVHVVTARLIFRAKGFRRAMVRNLVGFCVDRCRGAPAFTALSSSSSSSSLGAAVTTTNDAVTTTPPPATTCLWNDNQLWTFDNNDKTTIEQVASMIHAAPASGLCLDHVLYGNSNNKGNAVKAKMPS